MAKNRRLTAKQLAFVEAYMGETDGNATEAARLAGYAGNDNTLASVGAENLRKPAILQEITIRQREDPLVMTRIERQRLLTEIATNELVQTKDRLKAIDQLAKTGGDYIKRLEVSGPSGEPITVKKLPVEQMSDEALAEMEFLLSKGGQTDD